MNFKAYMLELWKFSDDERWGMKMIKMMEINLGSCARGIWGALIGRSESESEMLLVTRQNDNHSPGPSSHQRSELSNTILSKFNRGDKRVWKCIPVPNGLGGKATLINISVSNGNLICHRMIIPAAPNQGDKVICWYTGFTLQAFV